MVHEVTTRIEEAGDFFRQHAAEAEELGRLPDAVSKQMREIGIIRMLQPKEYGGYAAAPHEFFEAVFALGARCGSAGWVGGVVGVHPWQLGQWDPRLPAELWGEDTDTWIASPYAPIGRAVKVEGGYRFSGRWPFSSGTDHCDWIILGGLMADESGAVVEDVTYNFVLPRSDYTIHQDSWDVMGLRGSGSKDVSIVDAFVPDHRVERQDAFNHGRAAAKVGIEDPTYKVPFYSIFPGAINAATLAMADGALEAFVDYTRSRVAARGQAAIKDSSQMITLGEAAADIRASKVAFLDGWKRMYDVVCAGEQVSDRMRLEMRADSVRAVRRSVDAVDRLFMNAGGGSLQRSHPLQRFWRDLHAGMNHMCSVAPPMYLNWADHTFGQPVEPGGW